jgi:hypothetical protein
MATGLTGTYEPAVPDGSPTVPTGKQPAPTSRAMSRMDTEQTIGNFAYAACMAVQATG